LTVLAAGAAGAAESALSIGGVVSTVLAFLSVPAIVSGLAWLWRIFSPSARIMARLTNDLAVYEKLPPSPEKHVFEAQMNQALRILNLRRAKYASLDKRAVAKNVGIGLGLLALLAVSVVLIALPFSTAPSLGGGRDLPLLFGTVSGAVATAVALGLSAFSRRALRKQEEKISAARAAASVGRAATAAAKKETGGREDFGS
jgi:hypothetical protein